jgi:hypothetical protein
MPKRLVHCFRLGKGADVLGNSLIDRKARRAKRVKNRAYISSNMGENEVYKEKWLRTRALVRGGRLG